MEPELRNDIKVCMTLDTEEVIALMLAVDHVGRVSDKTKTKFLNLYRRLSEAQTRLVDMHAEQFIKETKGLV